MKCPTVQDLLGQKLDLEYRALRVSFEAHAFEFHNGWDCAYDCLYRGDDDAQGSGKGAWEQDTVPSRADAIVRLLRSQVARIERELTPGHWDYEDNKVRNAAYAKFLVWLKAQLEAWDMPLFADNPNPRRK